MKYVTTSATDNLDVYIKLKHPALFKEIENSVLLQKALSFATEKHSAQTRKWTNEPYIVHPIAVADSAIRFVIEDCPDYNIEKEGIECIGAIALLHDVLEDCDCTYNELQSLFNEDISYMVYQLSNLLPKDKFNRKSRSEIYSVGFRSAFSSAKIIKCFDILDNMQSIKTHDPKFYNVWKEERLFLLDTSKNELFGGGILDKLYTKVMEKLNDN